MQMQIYKNESKCNILILNFKVAGSCFRITSNLSSVQNPKTLALLFVDTPAMPTRSPPITTTYTHIEAYTNHALCPPPSNPEGLPRRIPIEECLSIGGPIDCAPIRHTVQRLNGPLCSPP